MGRYLAMRPLFEYWTHGDMVEQALQLLKKDGASAYSVLLPHADALVKGSVHADLPLPGGYILHTYHYHHPWSHRGYLVQKSAASVTADLFQHSVELWRKHRCRQAAYQLGRSLHLLQDAFIPHHAGLTAVRGHGEFEKWLSEHWQEYAPQEGGFYQWQKVFRLPLCGSEHRLSWQCAFDWVDVAAHLSFPWLDALDGAICPQHRMRYPEAAALLIPASLRFTAGYLQAFCQQAKVAALR